MAAGPAADPDKLEQLHRQLLGDPTLQFHFEHMEPPKPTEPPDWLVRLIELVAPLLSYIFWAGLLAVAALIAYALISEVLRRLPATQEEAKQDELPPVPEYRPATERAHALLEEADRLAKEGRYGEAVRVLLHRSIEDMETAFPASIAPSMTSREISTVEHLSTQGRATFTKIARAVEYSLFAGHPLSSDTYVECRRAYESFALEAPAT